MTASFVLMKNTATVPQREYMGTVYCIRTIYPKKSGEGNREHEPLIKQGTEIALMKEQ